MKKKTDKQSVKYPPQSAQAHELRDAMAPLSGMAEPSEPMLRTQIYLSRAEHEFVRVQAAEHGEPMASIIRGFIEEKMRVPAGAWSDNPMLQPTPKDAGFELPEDAAINHDHYLYGAPKKYAKTRSGWKLARGGEQG